MPSSGMPSGPFAFLISTPSGLFEPTSCSAMRCAIDEEHERERQRDDVQREEAVQRDVGDVVVAADPLGERVARRTGMAPNSDTITCAPQ